MSGQNFQSPGQPGMINQRATGSEGPTSQGNGALQTALMQRFAPGAGTMMKPPVGQMQPTQMPQMQSPSMFGGAAQHWMPPTQMPNQAPIAQAFGGLQNQPTANAMGGIMPTMMPAPQAPGMPQGMPQNGGLSQGMPHFGFNPQVR